MAAGAYADGRLYPLDGRYAYVVETYGEPPEGTSP